MAKRKKYNNGTGIEAPGVALARNQQAIAKASANSTSDLTNFLDMLGGYSMEVGSNLISKGLSSGGGGSSISKISNETQGDVNYNPYDLLKTLQGNASQVLNAANGGVVPVEVEGGESANLPTGKTVDFKGPSHSKGGIDVDLPGGTEIFSDRIQLDGMTMGERNLFRAKKLKKLSTLAGDSELTKNTYERTKKAFDIDKENDLLVQSLIGATDKKSPEKFADGGKVKVEGEKPSMFDNLFSGMTGILDGYTAGDLVGMYSSFKKGTAGQKNTENHRAGQTPNINPFEDYGKEGLKTLDSAMDFGDDVLQNNLLNIENSRSQATDQSRATSRGINTMRATDLSNSLASSTAKNQAYSGFADSMMKMLTQKSAMENDQDLKVMSGEQMRDENDRNDYDAYYANKGQDTQAMFEAITQMGKNMNQKKARDVQTELINSMSKYFDIDIKTGKLKSKKD